MVESNQAGGADGALAGFLLSNPLSVFQRQMREQGGRRRFASLLKMDVLADWFVLLSRFADQAPYTYWDEDQMRAALEILRRDSIRTKAAIAAWSDPLSLGIDNLLLSSSVSQHEDGLSELDFRDVVRIVFEFHPEYLRRVEHMLGQIIPMYASILMDKHSPTRSKVDLKSICDRLESRGLSILVSGYDEDVRNGIAHGEVELTADAIRYGGTHKHDVSAWEFADLFDQVWRTCVGLVLAVVLFLAENDDAPRPRAVSLLLASANVEHPGMTYNGSIESQWNKEQGLHVDLDDEFGSLESQMFDCGRFAAYLVRDSDRPYERILFSVRNPMAVVPSLVIVKGTLLSGLMKTGASIDTLPEVFESPPLVWSRQSPWSRRITTWRLILTSGLPALREQTRNILRTRKWPWPIVGDLYRTRTVENISSGWRARVKVTVVLTDPSTASDRDAIRNIAIHAVRHARRNLVRLTFGMHKPSVLRRRPSTIIVSVYAKDGPLRWVHGIGWGGDNLTAMAERKWGRWRPYVQVLLPNETCKRTRLQYEIRWPGSPDSTAETN